MRLLLLLACTGCSTVLGIDDLSGPLAGDAAGDSSTPPDGPVIPPGGILVAGTVVTNTLDGVPNATVELIDQPAVISKVMTTTGDDGAFELVIDANGNPFDGAALRASAPSSTTLATLAYFRQPLSPDLPITGVQLQIFDDGTVEMLANMCGFPGSPFKSVFIVFTVDAQGSAVPNTPFNTAPNATFCTERNGTFGPTTDTGPSGIAFAFDLPPGSVTVSSGFGQRTGRAEISTVTEVSLIP